MCQLLRQPFQTHWSSVAHHWIPVQRAMSMKFSPPMTLLARRAMSVVAAAAAGIFLATVTSTRCSRPYTSCAQHRVLPSGSSCQPQPPGNGPNQGALQVTCNCSNHHVGLQHDLQWSSRKFRQQKALQILLSMWNGIPGIGHLLRCP